LPRMGLTVEMTGKRVISAAQHRGNNQASILCMKFGW
jgi:hypothetical protein